MIRSSLAVLGIVATTACSTLQPVDSPSAFVQERRPDWVRVTNNDGSTLVLRRPTVVDGAVQGWETQSREEVKISPSAIQRMEAKQIDRTRTALLVGGGVLAAAGAAWAINAAANGPSLICDGYELPRRCQERPGIRLQFAIPR